MDLTSTPLVCVDVCMCVYVCARAFVRACVRVPCTCGLVFDASLFAKAECGNACIEVVVAGARMYQQVCFEHSLAILQGSFGEHT